MDGSNVNDAEMADETRKGNENGPDQRRRAEKGKDGETKKNEQGRKYLKEATMVINVDGENEIKAMDIIDAVNERIGGGNIIAVRPRQGKEYELTLETEEMCDKLMDGITIKGTDYELKKLQNRDYVVSFMHLPVYLEDKEILNKLESWGVFPISILKRRRYPGTNIEDGTRFLKVRFPREVLSLPYSTKLETAEGPQYFRVMHSHQVKTCRLCMSPDHLVKDCPDFKCFKCGERGHFSRDCNPVKCPDCQKFLNKCECWWEEEERGGVIRVDGQMHEGNNEKERQADEGQNEEGRQQKETEEGRQQKETEEGTNNGEEKEREKENDENNEQTTEQIAQETNMDTTDGFNTFMEDTERDGQRKMDQNKESDSEEEIKMDSMDKDRGVRGQRRRRTLKVQPNLEVTRKKMMTKMNKYDMLRGLEGENSK